MSDDDARRIDDDAATAPFVPSGWHLERAISAWQQLRAEIVEDEDLLVDEAVIASALRRAGAHDPRELLSALIDACAWSERREDEAKLIAAEFTERARRYAARVERFRALIDQLMQAIPVERHAGRLARVSYQKAPPHSVITDEAKIPGMYWEMKRTLRRADLLADLKLGLVIDGAELSNPGEPVLRLTRMK